MTSPGTHHTRLICQTIVHDSSLYRKNCVSLAVAFFSSRHSRLRGNDGYRSNRRLKKRYRMRKTPTVVYYGFTHNLLRHVRSTPLFAVMQRVLAQRPGRFIDVGANLGLFGLAAFMAKQRTKEIGIRSGRPMAGSSPSCFGRRASPGRMRPPLRMRRWPERLGARAGGPAPGHTWPRPRGCVRAPAHSRPGRVRAGWSPRKAAPGRSSSPPRRAVAR